MTEGKTVRAASPLIDAFLCNARTRGDAIALRELVAGGAPADLELTWREWEHAAVRGAAALVASELRPCDRVAILGGNSVFWPIADLSVLLAGGVSVGIFPTASPKQIREIIEDAGIRIVLTDSAAQYEKLRDIDLAGVLIVAPAADGHAMTWSAWQAMGQAALDDRDVRAALDDRMYCTSADDIALLIYTSGSTGEPKGAALTHHTAYSSACSIREALQLTETDTALSFLPFSHSAERIFGLYTRIVVGMQTGLVRDHARVWDAAQAFEPTVFGGLPRFYERIWEALQREYAGSGPALREQWDRALELGRMRSQHRRSGAAVPEALESAWMCNIEPVLDRIHGFTGGRVRVATSGGAMLPVAVAEYLDAAGLSVLGAYGLTEHLCVAMHRADRFGFDSAGPAMPGTTLKLADDGEILVRRSALTFSGYYGKADATAAAFSSDGQWLITGDLGSIDADGMLRIIGRKKELIALSTGKKVAPLPIEARLTSDPLISQAVVCGEGRKYITALLVLREDVVNGDMHLHIQEVLDRVNADLSAPEQIRRFHVLSRELTPEAGELTATLKVRRNVVIERFRDELDALYAGPRE